MLPNSGVVGKAASKRGVPPQAVNTKRAMPASGRVSPTFGPEKVRACQAGRYPTPPADVDRLPPLIAAQASRGACATLSTTKKEENTMKADLYQRVTDQIVASLEQGVRPWQKPWSASAITGRIVLPFRGNGVGAGQALVIQSLVVGSTGRSESFQSPWP